MDTMSKLVSRISFIEGILDRRQEALVDDVPSLEMTQDQVLSESFIPTRVSCKGANVLPSSSPGPDSDIFPRCLANPDCTGQASRISEKPLLPDRETKIAGGTQDKCSGSAPLTVELQGSDNQCQTR